VLGQLELVKVLAQLQGLLLLLEQLQPVIGLQPSSWLHSEQSFHLSMQI